MSRSSIAVLAAAFALAHAPYLASTLEDIDSVNFALGVRDFDVAEHRPHPPGYPVYIACGKLAVAIAGLVTGDAAQSHVEARGLSALALVGALAAIVLLYRLMASLSSARAQAEVDLGTPPWRALDAAALASTALVAASPLFWYLAVRPMSDVPGLAAALASQACLALAWWRQQPSAAADRRLTPQRLVASGRMIVLGALLAAIATGFRAQNAVLTVPLLLGVLLDRVGRGFAGAAIGASVAFGVGTALWGIPLIVASGGWNAYLAALGSQAGEDFAGVQMLYLSPTPRLVAQALVSTFIDPWDSLVLGGAVVGLALVGVVALLLRDRRSLAAVTLIGLPYLAFHLAFHDTSYVRYALPVVPPVCFLAVRGVEWIAARAALPIVGALAIWGVSIAAPVLAVYASEGSPVSRALAQMNSGELPAPGAVAFHQTFRRPLQAEQLSVGPILPSPPQREWLELVKYWRDGRTQPLWFLADPRRTDLALVDPQSRQDYVEYRWGFDSLSAVGGMRPFAVRWYRMPPPGWFAGEGWALTPETAGIAERMGRGPSIAPVTAWVRRRSAPATALVGGRHLGAPGDPAARVAVALDGVDIAEWDVAPGFFLYDVKVPTALLAGDGLSTLTVRTVSGIGGRPPVAIEQFDLQSEGTLMWGYEDGWHEAEFTPALGVWRWTSDRATLRILGADAPLIVSMRVERPRRYFDDDPVVRLLAGEQLLAQTTFASDEMWRVAVPLEAIEASGGRLTIETSRTFVPADRGITADRRRLGLRVFEVAVAREH